MTRPLTSTEGLPAGVARPAYDRTRLRAGVLHLGPGAFFRSHLAVFTDDALALSGGDWGIAAGGLRNDRTAGSLNAQNGLYTLIVRDAAGARARVVGAVTGGVARADLLTRMSDPRIHIVSLTVSEKGYGLDPATGGLDQAHPDIAADLAAPSKPRSAVGLIAAALKSRRAAGLAPFTPLSCDNLSSNGTVLRRLVVEFAEIHDPGLADWIAECVPIPSTMVDRITPASTVNTYADASRLTGRKDQLAVEAESFSQWVIEDRFADGRPQWDRAGALFVSDVMPYEKMKLRMLNGTHSLLAYLGIASGHEHVRDAMADSQIAAAARAHLAAAAATLDPVPGIDLRTYAEDLVSRFANPAVAHRIAQIATDGTQKLPPRVFEPTCEILTRGGDAGSYALIAAAWMHHVATIGRDGQPGVLCDPRATEIHAAVDRVERRAEAIAETLFSLPGLFPARLREHRGWRRQVVARLKQLLEKA